MDVFMIGNGFDLHYCLPTTYTCFLRTVENICKRLASGEQLTSVAQIISDPELHSIDRAMKRCFDTYGSSYDAEIDPSQVDKIFRHAEHNMWFSYLLNSFAPEKGWIDFEQEISKVIAVITSSMENYERVGDPSKINLIVDAVDTNTNRVLQYFKCFYDENNVHQGFYRDAAGNTISEGYAYPVLREYIAEEPYGSKNYTISLSNLSESLFTSLQELVNMLAAYLSFFVDRPVARLIKKNQFKKDEMLCNWKWRDSTVVSFNYTHTLEQLYYASQNPIKDVFYIHGELSNPKRQNSGNLVLGINADKSDNLDQVDVTFLPFKKYYQRAFHRTDLPYISFLSKYTPDELHENFYNLYVIGHSLDITDQEVIRDCFSRAITIHIFYYSPSDLSTKISNLVKIYKKNGFDELRTKKNLQFHPIDTLKEAEPFPSKPFPMPPPPIVWNIK